MRKTVRYAIGLGLLCAATAQASTQFFNLNVDPITLTPPIASIYGNAVWFPTGGAGWATNANDGFLRVTDALGSQRSVIVFADFDNGLVIQGFTFDADFRVGNGTTSPADGFSVNYVRADDPVLSVVRADADPSTAGSDPTPPAGAPWTGLGVFATGPNNENNLPEEGTWTGISVGFDCWNSGGTAPYPYEAPGFQQPDIVGLDIRVDGILQTQVPMPTLNGSVSDATSLQTGPNDTSNSTNGLGWAHLTISVDTNGVLNVTWKGTKVVNNYQTAYFPSAGALVFAGRTGGAWEIQDVDNIGIVTIPATGAVAGGATGLPDGVEVTFSDSGPGIVDPTKGATVSIDGGPAVAASAVVKNGAVTTVIYYSYPTLLTAGSTHTVTASVTDTLGRTATAASRSFVVAAYNVVNSAWAVASATQPGFRILPWQSGGGTSGLQAEPNNVWWADEQLRGLHGANNATTGSDGGYYDYNGLINFNITPASAGGNDIGDFTTANGYPDSLFPGIPGNNGVTDSSSIEAFCFLQFQKGGVYTMGVNSDDGFDVTVGPNPADWGALSLGAFGLPASGYNAGRGAADTLFTFVVTNAGFYPFRLLWENGTGGANCEWFVVQPDGTKILINDPNPPENTGIQAFYSGPALPAYVSELGPNPSVATGRPDGFIAMLADGGTKVLQTAGAIKAYINGTLAPTPAISYVGGVTTVTLPGYLLPSGANTAQLVYSTTGGGPYTNAWSFTVLPSFGALNASWAVTGVDPTQPGFRILPWQSGTQPNTVRYTQEQLAGVYGANLADLSTATDGGYIDYTGLINFNLDQNIPPNGTDEIGDFQTGNGYPDSPFPGLYLSPFQGNFPILDTGDESLQVLAYLKFAQTGVYEMGVNSDDGFAVTAGLNPSDWFAPVLGEFNAGRGSSDTLFTFQVTNTAGFYPFQLLYENGNGSYSGGNDANLEWFVVQPDGTKVLINDPNPPENPGVAAYFTGLSGSIQLPAYISEFFPAPGATGVRPDAFLVQLTDGSTTVDLGSIQVLLNGVAVQYSAVKAPGGVTTVTLPVTLLPTVTTNAAFIYSTGNGTAFFTNTWNFTVMQWGGISPAWAVTGVDNTLPGFLVRPWKSSGEDNAGEPNDVLRWTEEQMVGAHGKNLADLSTATDGGYIDYATGTDVTHLINWNNSGQIGDFQSPNYPDNPFPGSGATTGAWDNSAEEVITYMYFSAPGLYEFGVNSDDGFSVKVGANPKDWLNATLCGWYEGGRGSSDSLFFINVTATGYYPVRLLWQNGGGGYNCEWFWVAPDGTKVLINDPIPPNAEILPMTAYYSKTGKLPAYVSEFYPAPGATGVEDGWVSITLTDGSTTVKQNSIALTINGQAVTPLISYVGGVTKVSLASPLAAGNYTVTFSYSTSGGGPFTSTWSFSTVGQQWGNAVLSTNLWTPPGSGSNPGFSMKVYQSSQQGGQTFNGWQNSSRMADESLHGFYDANAVTDTTQWYTNHGAMWWPGIINFAQNGSGGLENNGAFQTTDGYTDAAVPGLPALSGNMNDDCYEAVTFLEFPTAGQYILGFTSDDGFRVTVGDQAAPDGTGLSVIAPASVAKTYVSMYTTTDDEGGNAGFGRTPPSTVPIIARAVLASPNNATSLGSLANASAMAGNVCVVVHNGNFETQAQMAKAAGAVAVLCCNNSGDVAYPGTRGAGSGTDPAFPCVSTSYACYQDLVNDGITTTATSPVIVRLTAQDCSMICGKYDNGRGSSDTLFTVDVPKAGLYPFRVIWFNGTGDATSEFFTDDLFTGDRTLINDASSPVKAWITRNVHAPSALPAPVLNTPVISGGNIIISWTGQGELWESYSLQGPWFKSTYQSNPSAVVPTPLLSERFFRVRQY